MSLIGDFDEGCTDKLALYCLKVNTYSHYLIFKMLTFSDGVAVIVGLQSGNTTRKLCKN